MASDLYNKALKVAIDEIGKQITLNGAKKIWTKWACFHKDKDFINAAWKKRKELEK